MQPVADFVRLMGGNGLSCVSSAIVRDMASLPRLRLHTIGTSHFCEKARWALQRAKIDFEERASAPIFHMAALPRGKKGSSTPLLELRDGTIIQDSTAILRWIDTQVDPSRRLFPDDNSIAAQVEAWEERADAHLGPAVRRCVYDELLPDPKASRMAFQAGAPRGQSVAVAVLRPVIAKAIRKGLGVHGSRVLKSRERLHELLDEVDAHLGTERRYLAGDRFTAADLSFAALFAPLIMPAGYGPAGAQFHVPPVLEKRAATYAARPSGQYVERMYQQHRNEVL